VIGEIATDGDQEKDDDDDYLDHVESSIRELNPEKIDALISKHQEHAFSMYSNNERALQIIHLLNPFREIHSKNEELCISKKCISAKKKLSPFS
jgi:hypothetical protein